MAIVTGVNSTSPNTIRWASAGSDPYVRASQLAGPVENFDVHDHDSAKGLGVKRVQTTAAPTAAGHVRVNTDTWQWWASSAAAVRTAVDVEGTQTITGAKTFSSTVNLGNGVADAGANNGFFRSNASVIVQIDHDNNATTEVFSVRANAAGTDVFSVSEVGTVTTGSGQITCPISANFTVRSPTTLLLEIDQDNNATTEFLGVRANGAATDLFRVNESGLVAVGDDANASMTQGLTINQGAADDEIVSLKSSDIAHGITGLTETDTYASLSKHDPSAGGLAVHGITETTVGLRLRGYNTTEDSTRSTSAVAPVTVSSFLKSGTSTTNPSANVNLFAVLAGSTARFIFDSDGDSHQDVGTAWTNFDAHDDLALLDATAALLERDPGNLRKSFTDGFLAENRAKLAALRVVTFNDDGHHFVNWSRFQMLHMGGTRLLADRVAALEARLAPAGA